MPGQELFSGIRGLRKLLGLADDKNRHQLQRRLILWENLASLANFATVLPLNSFLAIVLQHLSQFFFSDFGAFVLFQEDGRISGYAYRKIDYEQHERLNNIFSAIFESQKKSPALRESVLKPAIFNQWERSEFFSELSPGLSSLKIGSALYLPLVHNGYLRAMLWLWSEKPDFFADNDSQLLTTVSAPIIDALDCNCIAQELRRERQRFTDILENIPLGIVETDRAGQVNFVNRSAEKILGIDRTMLINQPLKDILSETGDGPIQYSQHGPNRLLQLQTINIGENQKIIVITDITETSNSRDKINRTLEKLTALTHQPIISIISDISSLALSGTLTESQYFTVNHLHQKCQELLLQCQLFKYLLRWELSETAISDDLRENSRRENIAQLFLKVLEKHPLAETPNISFSSLPKADTNINTQLWEVFFFSLLEQLGPIARPKPVAVKFSCPDDFLQINIENNEELSGFLKNKNEFTCQFLDKFLQALTATIDYQNNSVVIRLRRNI